ncbi:3'-5' exonuclease [bacterium]|nr:MAG: 3'-5' exonuclease [bacterium]
MWSLMSSLMKIIHWAIRVKNPRENPLTPGPDTGVVLDCKYKTAAEKNIIHPSVKLAQARFVVFDLETTGFHPYAGDEIISVSGVVIDKGRIKTDTYYDTLINPRRPIPPLTTEITGISDEMVTNAPTVLYGLRDFLDFARGAILVAHNADFDLHFINLKLKQLCQTKLYHPVIDTFLLAQALIPCEKCHTLDALIKMYGIAPRGRHTSLGDAVIAAQLLMYFIPMLNERGVHTYDDLQKYLHFRSYQ